jgi:hypothetical protein
MSTSPSKLPTNLLPSFSPRISGLDLAHQNMSLVILEGYSDSIQGGSISTHSPVEGPKACLSCAPHARAGTHMAARNHQPN